MHRKTVERLFLSLKILFDIIFINGTFALAYGVRFKLGFFPVRTIPQFEYYYNTLFVVTLVWLAIFNLMGLYKKEERFSFGIDELFKVFSAVTMGSIIIMAITFIYRVFSYSRLMMGFAWIFGMILLGMSRYVIFGLQRLARQKGWGSKKAALIGKGGIAAAMAQKLAEMPVFGLSLEGFIGEAPSGYKMLGEINDLAAVVKKNDISEIFIADPDFSRDKMAEIASFCDRQGIGLKIIPGFFEIASSGVEVNYLDGIPLLSLRESPLTPWNRVVKRTADIVLSLLFLLILSPLLLMVAFLVKVTSPGPILYQQSRVGRNGKGFMMYKFRSMIKGAEEQLKELLPYNEAEGHIFKMKHDPRITPIGRFIRRFSIDELPQLFNVLKGKMSLVGPRPPLPHEVIDYAEWHKKRLDIAPGITGLWQVSGRSQLPFDDMVRLDIYYIENWSLWQDFKVILKTIPVVLFARGAY